MSRSESANRIRWRQTLEKGERKYILYGFVVVVRTSRMRGTFRCCRIWSRHPIWIYFIINLCSFQGRHHYYPAERPFHLCEWWRRKNSIKLQSIREPEDQSDFVFIEISIIEKYLLSHIIIIIIIAPRALASIRHICWDFKWNSTCNRAEWTIRSRWRMEKSKRNSTIDNHFHFIVTVNSIGLRAAVHLNNCYYCRVHCCFFPVHWRQLCFNARYHYAMFSIIRLWTNRKSFPGS